jgi:hypothetical protein
MKDEVYPPLSVPEGASEALAKLEAAVEGPRENRTAGGPRPTPIKKSPTKRRRLIARASRKASRPRKATRRQRRRHVAPRMA